MVCSNTYSRKRLTQSNRTPAMDLGHMNAVLMCLNDGNGFRNWNGYYCNYYLFCFVYYNRHTRLSSQHIRNAYGWCAVSLRLSYLFFVCLSVVIKPENLYFASRSGLEVKLLNIYPLGPRSSYCGPIKGTPPPRTTLRANGGFKTLYKLTGVGSHSWTYTRPTQTHPQPPNSVPRSSTSDPPEP